MQSSSAAFVVILFALLVPNQAFGQDVPARAQPVEEADPQGDAPAEAPAEPTEVPTEPVDPKFAEAKQRFLQGVALAKAGNCEGAISELRASYAIVARTNTLFNIAHCHEELFQYTLAIEAYEKFLEIAEPGDPDTVRVEATISSLRSLLGTLNITSNIPAEVWIGDRKIGSAPGELLVPGGRHVVELRADGYLAARQEVDIAGRKSLALDFTLIVAQKKVTITKIKSRGLPPIYFWSGTAATGLAFAGGLYFGLRAKLEDTSARSIDPRLPRDTERDDIETLANVADVFFIGAGVFAVGTTVTYFLTDWKKGDAAEAPLRVQPTIGPNAWGISLEGRL